MSDPLEMICELSGCKRDEAEAAFAETKDVVESVDRLMAKSELKSQKYLNYGKNFIKRQQKLFT